MIIFDIEADHLLPDVTKVHCMVLKNLRTGNVVRIEPDNIQMGLGILQGAKAIGGHNIMAYDLPVLKKLYNFEYKGKVFDTLVASRLIWSNLKEIDLLKRTVDSNLIGSHSLKAWGQRLKFNKGDYGEYEGAFDKQFEGTFVSTSDFFTGFFLHGNFEGSYASNYSKDYLKVIEDVNEVRKINGKEFANLITKILNIIVL